MRCRYCGEAMAFRLDLVKDGILHECFKCTCGAWELRRKDEVGLPVEIDKRTDVLIIRLRCRNVYIFDREIFNDFTRRISRDLTEEPTHVVLDLSEIGYVPEADLLSLVRLRRFLQRIGKQLRIVQRSDLFRSNLKGIDPEAEQYLFRDEAEACRLPFPGDASSGDAGPGGREG